MSSRHLTVRERVIVHLSQYSRYSEEYECPEAMSQAGIAQAIGKSRAHTTLELNRMKQAGLVTERLAHVKGAKSKRKTYTITHKAHVIESQITGQVHAMEIDLSGPGGNRFNGGQAAELLMRELPVSRALAFDIVLSSEGNIDLKLERDRRIARPDGAETRPVRLSTPENRTFDGFLTAAKRLSKQGRLEDALGALERAMGAAPSIIELSKAHYTRASIHRKRGDYTSALGEIDTAMQTVGDSGASLFVGRCRMEKAMILSGMGDEAQSLELLDSAEEIFRLWDSQVDLLRCGINQGIVLRNLGKVTEALDLLVLALELAERTGYEQLEAHALVNITDLLNEREEFERSRALAQKARDIYQALDDPIMMAAASFNLGQALAGLGETEAAMANLDNAIAILEANGLLTSRTRWVEEYATILEGMGEREKAGALLKKL